MTRKPWLTPLGLAFIAVGRQNRVKFCTMGDAFGVSKSTIQGAHRRLVLKKPIRVGPRPSRAHPKEIKLATSTRSAYWDEKLVEPWAVRRARKQAERARASPA